MSDFFTELLQFQDGDPVTALTVGILLYLVCIVVFAPRVRAADYVADWTAWTSTQGTDMQLRSIGDVNNDGIADVAWCTFRPGTGIDSGDCELYLISGDGTVIDSTKNNRGEDWAYDVAALNHNHPDPAPDTTLIIVGAPTYGVFYQVDTLIDPCCDRCEGALYVYRYATDAPGIAPACLIRGHDSLNSIYTEIGANLVVGDFDHDFLP